MGVGYTWEPRLCLLKLRGELPPGGHAQPEGLRGAPGKREGRTQGQGDRKSLGSGEHRRMRVCVCDVSSSVSGHSVGGHCVSGHSSLGTSAVGRPREASPAGGCTAGVHLSRSRGGASAWLCNVPPDSKDTDVCSTQDTLAPILPPPERALSIKVLPKQEKF